MRLGRILPWPRITRALLLCASGLMFSSALSSLRAGTPNWRNLTALTYHYWSQPLPPCDGLVRGQAAAPCSIGSRAPSYLLDELGGAVLHPGAPRLRLLCVRPRWRGSEALIALTGNYAFFNLLTRSRAVLPAVGRRLLSRRAPALTRRRPRVRARPGVGSRGLVRRPRAGDELLSTSHGGAALAPRRGRAR